MISLDIQFAYFILSLGFIISMFSVLICFIVIEYIKGCRDETVDFIIVGLNKYKNIFKLADKLIYIDSICFIAPINILIHNSVGRFFGIIFNIICLTLLFFGIYFHYIVIIRKQKYVHNNKNYYRRIYS